ncbi:MAG: hypothetical protein WCT26_02265 [Candidatus Buchananbacteria bacterium]|jgi:hypothetical protein
MSNQQYIYFKPEAIKCIFEEMGDYRAEISSKIRRINEIKFGPNSDGSESENPYINDFTINYEMMTLIIYYSLKVSEDTHVMAIPLNGVYDLNWVD